MASHAGKRQRIDELAPAQEQAQQQPPAAAASASQEQQHMSALQQYKAKLISFNVVVNDGKRESLRKLVELKNLICNQLTEMPREYIVRQVFARNHENLVLMQRGRVTGGCAYRPFYEQHLVEIVFLAVRSNEQVKGYGRLLMNALKETVKQRGVTHMLTYADNDAVGYFRKQGFTREITMRPSLWVGRVKDYDGGTIMECLVSHDVDYLSMPSMLKRQKDEVNAVLKLKTPFFEEYPGLRCFKEQAAKAAAAAQAGSAGSAGTTAAAAGPDAAAAAPRAVPAHMQIPVESIPGVLQAGFTPSRKRARPQQAVLRRFLQDVLQAVRNHSLAWPFQVPVRRADVWDYYDVVKDPIDLTLIQQRMEEGYYVTLPAFTADLRRMCANCRTYNAQTTEYYKCAVGLEDFIVKRIENSMPLPLEPTGDSTGREPKPAADTAAAAAATAAAAASRSSPVPEKPAS